jgi:hypothetical protein
MAGLALWLYSLFLGINEEEELNPITIQDVDPLPPLPVPRNNTNSTNLL